MATDNSAVMSTGKEGGGEKGVEQGEVGINDDGRLDFGGEHTTTTYK